MEQLCERRTQGIRTRKASGLSGGTGGETGVSSRNTRGMRRASKKSGVHRKNKKLLYDTREISSSSGKAGGIEGNTRKSWRNTRKKGRTEKPVLAVETPGEGGELLKSLVYTGKTRSFCMTPEKVEVLHRKLV